MLVRYGCVQWGLVVVVVQVVGVMVVVEGQRTVAQWRRLVARWRGHARGRLRHVPVGDVLSIARVVVVGQHGRNGECRCLVRLGVTGR